MEFCSLFFFFFFNGTATTEIYTLSLHDALPICEENHCLVIRARKDIQAHPVWMVTVEAMVKKAAEA